MSRALHVDYDVIIVGARCAGAPTAMLLARRGHRVLLCDRASFPSDTVSNGAFNLPGPLYLRRWRLLDRLLATGVPPVAGMILHSGGGAQHVDFGGLVVYAPMRMVLDAVLVEAAVEAGAELRERFRVTDLVVEDGVVAGVRGSDGDVVRGRLVVGADGRRSTVARRVRAQEFDHVPMSGGGVYAYFDGVSTEGYEFWLGPGGWAMLAPSNDDLTHVATASAFTAGAPQERFDAVLGAYPDLRGRVAAGRRRTRLVTYRDAPVFFRRGFGPGWALVGDAGFHQGPWNGYGMSHAFRDADRLAEAVDAWLSGEPFDDALGAYERDRDEWCRPFRDNILAIVTALRDGRPQDAPWGGELPHVQRWLQRLSPSDDGRP